MNFQPSSNQPHPALFDLTDAAERFMAEVIHRFHANGPMPCRVLATRRVVAAKEGKRHRLVLQAARFQPQRRGARPVWDVLVWDIDDLGVRFLTRTTRTAMLELYRSLTASELAPTS